MVNEMLFAACAETEPYYENGQPLSEDRHFLDHLEHGVPIQIYKGKEHIEIGFIEQFCSAAVIVNGLGFCRHTYLFVSRPGY